MNANVMPKRCHCAKIKRIFGFVMTKCSLLPVTALRSNPPAQRESRIQNLVMEDPTPKLFLRQNILAFICEQLDKQTVHDKLLHL